MNSKKTLLVAFVILASMVYATAAHFVYAARSLGVKNERDYHSKLGARPEVHALTWNLFDVGAHAGNEVKLQPKHLLWATMFLRTYAREAVLANTAGVCRATYRKCIWTVIPRISGLRRHVTQLVNRFRGDRGRTCKMTVDCTDCMLREPRPFSKDWFTYKHKCAGFRYEVGVCIQTGDICWINGPFKCGIWPDIRIFHRNLKWLLRVGEMVECDDGYRGDPSCRHKHQAFSNDDRQAKAGSRARHEVINRGIKRFECLCVPWCHPRHLHAHAFAACAVLTQLGYNLNGGGPHQIHC